MKRARLAPRTDRRSRSSIVKRRPERPDQILGAALKLFHERGYHATSIDDIGRAVGLSGPGVYRHFRSKEAILEAILERVGVPVVERVREIVHATANPLEALEELVANLVDGVVSQPILASVVRSEYRALGRKAQRWYDEALELMTAAWADALRAQRPELAPGHARVMVRAAMALVMLPADLPDVPATPAVSAILKRMAMSALTADVTQVEGRTVRAPAGRVGA